MRDFRSTLMTATVLLFGIFFFSLGSVAYASDWSEGALFKPFGGKITSIRPCLGSGLVVATILQPPFMTPLDVAAFPSPFLYHMMSYPGQFVLGLIGAPSFCATSPHSGFWAPASSFYGTSAPGGASGAGGLFGGGGASGGF